jgi:hypothetical protein
VILDSFSGKLSGEARIPDGFSGKLLGEAKYPMASSVSCPGEAEIQCVRYVVRYLSFTQQLTREAVASPDSLSEKPLGIPPDFT